MMTFRLLSHKHQNLLNKHLLRRVVEILRVRKEMARHLPLPLNLNLSFHHPLVAEPIVLSPPKYELIYETEIELQHEA